MGQKAFAVGDLIINDWEGIESSNSTIHSVLSNGVGLPVARGNLLQRHGRWPLFGSLARRGHSLALDSRFYPGVGSTAANRETLRRNLLAEINPELESTVNLYAADEVMPYGNILAFGPWDARVDSSGAWTMEDILGRATATISNAVHFDDGEQSRQKAMVIEEATTNEVANPSLEVAVGAQWILSGAGTTIARVTTEYKFGVASLEVVTPGSGANEGAYYEDTAGVTASQTHTASAWVKGTVGDLLQIRLQELTPIGGNVDSVTETFTATGDWQRVSVSNTFGATGERFRIFIEAQGTSAYTFYVDGAQFEQNQSFATSYCDGSLGPGYTWSGTAHDSSSSRTATRFNLDAHADLISEVDTLSFRVVAQMPYDADDANWPKSTVNLLWDTRGADNNNRIRLVYDSSNDTFAVYINGDTRIASSAQTTAWDANAWLDLIVILDFTNDSYKLYIDGSVDGTDTTSLSAPTLTEFNLGTSYAGGSQGGFAFAEFQVWDRVLTASEISSLNTNGTGAGRCRYVESICESAAPLVIGGAPTDQGIVSAYRLNDDVRWRSRDGDASFWSIYANTSTHYLTNDGDDDAYPIIRLTPVTAKTGAYSKRRWIAVTYNADTGHVLYPIRVSFDTATEVSGGDMQADCDDLRIWSDGQEIDRWLDSPNDAATKIWFNLDFQATISLTLTSAIGSGDTVTEIELNESINDLPESGILYLTDTSTEAFTYTGKVNSTKKVIGVTRATKGTSAGNHTASDTVDWIQHDVWMLYGNSTATAPTTDDDYKPIMELDTSTNTSWVYANFREDYLSRAGSWEKFYIDKSPTFYGGNQATTANPWVELGISLNQLYERGLMAMWNPCGITNANFTNGEHWATTKTEFEGRIYSWDVGGTPSSEHKIPDPANDAAWDTWSRNEALASGTTFVGLGTYNQYFSSGTVRVEAADCTLTLDSTYTPTVTVGSEVSAYDFDLTLTNSTTGDAISVAVTVGLDEILEIDTSQKTVTNLNDNTSELQGISLVDGPRRDWLRFQKGDNTLTWSDTGTNEVDVEILWDRRYWE